MMTRILGTVCLLAVLLAGAGPAGAQSASPSPTPDVAARAKEWLHRLQTGDIDRSQLTDTMNTALTPDVVKEIVAKYGPLGDPQSFTFLGQQPAPQDATMTVYVYRVAFKSTTLNEVFVLDKEGKIAGVQFPPAQ
jgi:hypothetical protein